MGIELIVAYFAATEKPCQRKISKFFSDQRHLPVTSTEQFRPPVVRADVQTAARRPAVQTPAQTPEHVPHVCLCRFRRAAHKAQTVAPGQPRAGGNPARAWINSHKRTNRVCPQIRRSGRQTDMHLPGERPEVLAAFHTRFLAQDVERPGDRPDGRWRPG